MEYIYLILDFSFSFGPRYLARASSSKRRHMKISRWMGRDSFGQEQINLGTLGYALARADILDPGSIALLFT